MNARLIESRAPFGKVSDLVVVQQYPMAYFGVMAIEAHLRKAGYSVDVLVDALEPDLIESLRDLNPKLIGFSVFSTEHAWLVHTVRRIRRAFPEATLIVGGVHAMVFAELILTETDADLVCCGDGESVLVPVLEELRLPQRDWSKINGLAYQIDHGEIRKNPPMALFPYPEDRIERRDIYFRRYPEFKEDAICYFISSRGCPFSCSFCYNSYLRNMTGAHGYLRRKNVGSFIQELEDAIPQYTSPRVFFIDDLFTFDKAWLREFLPEYKRKIGLPFVCMTRAKILDEEIARMLSESGCRSVSFGIETGNERLRKTVLNKPITNEDIVQCGQLLKKHGLVTRSSSMFCLPDESLRNALETVDLNIQAQVDLAASMLLIPYPQTAITDYLRQKGMIDPNYSLRDIPTLAYRRSVVDISEKRKIMNVHFLLFFFVKYPFFYKCFRWVVHVEALNSLLYLFFLVGCFIRNKDENGLGWVAALLYAWRKRSLMKQRAGEAD